MPSAGMYVFGLLMETASEIPRHRTVSFTMIIQGGKIVHPIRLTGEGKVVRVEPSGSSAWFAIAVACKHPIAQIEDYTADAL
jgi:hypothetical protein